MSGPAGGPFDARALALGVLFAILWSSAFTSAKIAVADAPPFTLLVVRFAFAGALVAGAARMLGEAWPKGARAWRSLALLGLCQNALYLGLNFLALGAVPAGVAATIASSLPLWVAAADARLFGEKLGARALFGMAIGFFGVLWVAGRRAGGEASAIGLALCLVAVLALTAATLLIRRADFGGGRAMAVGVQMLWGAAALLPVALVFEDASATRFTPSLALAFLYMVFMPGILATFVWFALIERVGAARAAAFHFLNPGLGVAVAWAVLGEPFGASDALGIAAAAFGIWLVQTRATPSLGRVSDPRRRDDQRNAVRSSSKRRKAARSGAS